jgi:hypothetical protein
VSDGDAISQEAGTLLLFKSLYLLPASLKKSLVVTLEDSKSAALEHQG